MSCLYHQRKEVFVIVLTEEMHRAKRTRAQKYMHSLE
jgi:hypothetical protein